MKKLLLAIILLLILPSQGESMIVSKILGSGYIGTWYMNSTSGNDEIDRSGHGNDLADNNGVAQSSTVPSGYTGKSKQFIEDNQEYLSITTAGTSLDFNGVNQKMTAACWVIVDEDDDSGEPCIVGQYDFGNNQRKWALRFDEDSGAGVNRFKFNISADGSATTDIINDTNLSVGTRYHVAVVSNDIDLRIYVNGVLDCTPVAHTTGMHKSTALFAIGILFNNGAPTTKSIDGNIDEVMVDDRAWSATEILNLKNNGLFNAKGGND